MDNRWNSLDFNLIKRATGLMREEGDDLLAGVFERFIKKVELIRDNEIKEMNKKIPALFREW